MLLENGIVFAIGTVSENKVLEKFLDNKVLDKFSIIFDISLQCPSR